MTQVSELRERTLYTARNQGDAAQTLIIEHPARPEWRLASAAKEPDEKAPGVSKRDKANLQLTKMIEDLQLEATL